MKKLLYFEINGEYRQYTVTSYKRENGFYIFTDEYRGQKKNYKISEQWYRGEREL